MGAGLSVGACALIGARLLIDGLMAHERAVAFTIAHVASLLALLAVITASACCLSAWPPRAPVESFWAPQAPAWHRPWSV